MRLSLSVADTLAAEGTSAEVVDLRTLIPLDVDTILTSVRKTGKALIVHEDNLTGGFGAEVAAVVSQQAFEHLDAPVTRVAAIDTPIPFTPCSSASICRRRRTSSTRLAIWPRTDLVSSPTGLPPFPAKICWT